MGTETASVAFRQNIGLLVLRFHKKVAGRLCPNCIDKHFWSTTLVTLVGGWWGLVSLILSPIFLLLNLTSYLGAVWDLARRRDAAFAREPWGATSLAIGVVAFPVMGLCGLVSLVGGVLGVIGLFAPKRPEASRAPAMLGIGVNGLCLTVIAAFVAFLFWLDAQPSPAAARPSPTSGASSAASASGRQAFDEANSRIHVYKEGETAFGNTPEAVELAKRFGTTMKVMSRLAFTGHRGDDAGTMTQGHFLTHVEMRADTVCFLAHVPQLRGYRGEVREALLDLAWTAARESTRQARPGRDVRLAVALRGVMLYGAVAIGPVSNEKPESKDFQGTASTDPLAEFFTGPVYSSPLPTATPFVAPTASPMPAPTPTPDLRPAIAPLSQMLRHRRVEERRSAASTLANIAAQFVTDETKYAALDAVIPELENASRDKDARLRLFSLRALANIQRKKAVPALVRGFDDPDPAVRREAMQNIVMYGTHARSGVPALIKRTRSPTRSDRLAAVPALASIATSVPEARADILPLLEALARDSDEHMRKLAAAGLEDVKKYGAPDTGAVATAR